MVHVPLPCRAASLLCTGHEHLHVELRARVTCELVLNKSYYLGEAIISSIAPDGEKICSGVLVGTSKLFDKVACATAHMKLTHEEFADLVFKEECISTTKLTNFSSMWHVHGICNVLKQPLMSIYPLIKMRWRPAFHKLIYPKDKCSSGVHYAIMWTHLTHMNLTDKWNPNHFVPCFILNHSQSLSTPFESFLPTFLQDASNITQATTCTSYCACNMNSTMNESSISTSIAPSKKTGHDRPAKHNLSNTSDCSNKRIKLEALVRVSSANIHKRKPMIQPRVELYMHPAKKPTQGKHL